MIFSAISEEKLLTFPQYREPVLYIYRLKCFVKYSRLQGVLIFNRLCEIIKDLIQLTLDFM
jgi:hypothetical protein